jgi:hypothetical protein
MRLLLLAGAALVALVISDPARASLPADGCKSPSELVAAFKIDSDWQNAVVVDGDHAKALIDAVNHVGQPTAFEGRALVVVRPKNDPDTVALVLFDACPKGFFFMSAKLFRTAVDHAFGAPQQ